MVNSTADGAISLSTSNLKNSESTLKNQSLVNHSKSNSTAKNSKTSTNQSVLAKITNKSVAKLEGVLEELEQ